jgi:hypothetical protein
MDSCSIRQNKLKEVYAESGRKPVSKAAYSPYLFSGFLTCGNCGAKLIIVSGGGKGARYGCPQHWNRKACDNEVTVKHTEVETQLLAGMQSAVLSPDVLEYLVSKVFKLVQKKKASN